MHCHITETFETEGTLIFMLRKLFKASFMHVVTTLELNWWLCWCMLIELTYWALRFENVWDAFMIRIVRSWHTAVASLTMSKVFSATLSANSTFLTMKLLLAWIIIIQIAYPTMIVTNLYSTSFTLVWWFLDLRTVQAFDKLDNKSIYFMLLLDILFVVILCFIVTESAREEFFAFFTLNLASCFVVGAS